MSESANEVRAEHDRLWAALRDIRFALGPDRICDCPPSDPSCGLREEAQHSLDLATAALDQGAAHSRVTTEVALGYPLSLPIDPRPLPGPARGTHGEGEA